MCEPRQHDVLASSNLITAVHKGFRSTQAVAAATQLSVVIALADALPVQLSAGNKIMLCQCCQG
eukprot:11681-Heterococcus_DN1.PRE.5